MKKIIILLLFILTIFLSGCYSYDNIAETLFVNTVAIDYDNEKDNYTVYYHMTNPATLTTESLGGGDSGNTFSIAKSEEKTIFKAMQIIEENSNKRIKLTHVQSYVFSINYLKYDHLKSFYEFIKTTPYLYSDFRVIVTDSKIEEIFKTADIEDTSPYYSIIVSSNENEETYKMTSLVDVTRGLNEKYSLSFPFVRTTKEVWATEKEPIYSLRIIGSIFLNENDDIFLAEEDKYPIICILKRRKSSELSLNDFNYIISKVKYKVKYIDENNFSIDINVEAYVAKYGDQNADPKEYFIEEMTKSLDMIIQDSKEKNIDLFSIKNILYRKNKLKNAFNIKDVNYHYNFSVKILETI